MQIRRILNLMLLIGVVLFSATADHAQTSDSSQIAKGEVQPAIPGDAGESQPNANSQETTKADADGIPPAVSSRASLGMSNRTPEEIDVTSRKNRDPATPIQASEAKNRPLPTPAPTPPPTNPEDFPDPIHDDAYNSFVLFELLEYGAAANGNNSLNWDMIGWYGGDYNRFWFRSEGEVEESSKANGDVEFQALYGRMIAPFWDFQAGLRFDNRWVDGKRASRFHAVLGVIGLSPYEYEIEPLFFVSDRGDVSFRFTGVKDILLTQRTIFEGRFETNLAAQRVEKFGVGSGLNDMEFGIRIRREIKREFAPYIGVSYKRLFGQTSDLARLAGGRADQLSLVAGVRLWF